MQIRLMAAYLVICAPLLSQSVEKAPTTPENITKIIRVQSDAGPIADLVRPASATDVRANSGLRVIVVKGRPADVAAVERSIHDLDNLSDTDIRGKNIELLIYLLDGSMEPADGKSGADIAALVPVYKQLRAVFPFKNYQLLSTTLMRSGQNTQTSSQGMIKSPQNNSKPDAFYPGTYEIRYDKASVSGDTSPVIHLSKLQFRARIPYLSGTPASPQFQQGNIEIETDVDLMEGQKVVVGTSNIEPAGSTLFLVVTAKLM